MIAGVAIAKDPQLIQRIRSRRSLFRQHPAAHECWCSISACHVSLRMNRQSKNAQRIADSSPDARRSSA